MAVDRQKKTTTQLVEQLKDLVLRKFPEARFEVTKMPDTRKSVAIWTYTNADFWEVSDVVSEREFEIMMDDGKFLYVIPMPLNPLDNGD